MSEHEGALLGMGNPLLDIINDVDQAFLDKYQVDEGLNGVNEYIYTALSQHQSSKLKYVAGMPF
jgi:hypothetical protein